MREDPLSFAATVPGSVLMTRASQSVPGPGTRGYCRAPAELVLLALAVGLTLIPEERETALQWKLSSPQHCGVYHGSGTTWVKSRVPTYGMNPFVRSSV